MFPSRDISPKHWYLISLIILIYFSYINTDFPHFKVELGEELLAIGNVTEGTEHLANAVAVCGQPQQLLGVLQKTLPPQIFELLLQKLPSVGQVLGRIEL